MISSDAPSAARFQTPRCGAGQIQVRRRASPQPVPGLAAIDLGHLAVLTEDRDDQRPGEMLMPAGAEDSQSLQAAPDVGAVPAALVRQRSPSVRSAYPSRNTSRASG